MGTDIHFYVEKRLNNRSLWQTADEWLDEAPYGPHVPYAKAYYSDRNYDLFAILANVRNGQGFAGVRTGAGFQPIAEPRGWPSDCCPELSSLDIGHTPSWLTLAEILDFDWTQTTTKTGWLSLQKWASWRMRPGEAPNDYWGGVRGPRIQHWTNEQVETRWLELNGKPGEYYKLELDPALQEAFAPGFEIWTEVEWQVTYSQAAKSFWYDTVPRLLRLGSPSNVRCVFFFDS